MKSSNAFAPTSKTFPNIKYSSSLKLLVFTKTFFIFRTFDVFKNDKNLQEMHENLKDTMESVMNISLGRETWTQLTLQVKLGEFGLQSPIELATSAFIASFVSCSSLATSLLNNHSPSDSFLLEALSLWQSMVGETSSITASMNKPLQKQWTNPVSKNNIGLLIEQSTTDLQKARLQGVNCRGEGDWLKALTSNPLGLCL